MTIKEMQNKFDESDYWDARVTCMESRYFGDEICIEFSDGNEGIIQYCFIGCYKSCFEHIKEYIKDKPVKCMTVPQIPYFFQDIKVDKIIEKNNHFWVCKINMYPLNVEIWCNDIKITKKDR